MTDICMIFEGSYPYTRGGVSEWAQQLISRLPETTFHLWCISSSRSAASKTVYELPPNVTGVSDIYLYDDDLGAGDEPIPDGVWPVIQRLHGKGQTVEDRGRILWNELVPLLPDSRVGLPISELLSGSRTYDTLLRLYADKASALPFLEYFYTFIFSHAPLLRLLSEPIPPARLYHTISTGYAGFLGCHARQRTGAPLILSEHGIYTNERLVEIVMADWIYSPRQQHIRVGPPVDSLKRVWMEMFDFLGRLTYTHADCITTLFKGNRRMQISLGAPPEKILLIPNGVDLERFGNIQRTDQKSPPVIGLVGRVVPIKDIRTFIKACRAVVDRIPEARFLVMGPTDQGEAYYAKCLEYRRLLNLEENLTFTGNVNVVEHYPKLSVVVLTSVSEGLPLTVLEAMACGVPLVCTRVGACEELLAGQEEENPPLGPTGLTAPVGDHRGIGRAILQILENPALARRMSKAGRTRVQRYYSLDAIVARYGELYREWIEKGRRD